MAASLARLLRFVTRGRLTVALVCSRPECNSPVPEWAEEGMLRGDSRPFCCQSCADEAFVAEDRCNVDGCPNTECGYGYCVDHGGDTRFPGPVATHCYLCGDPTNGNIVDDSGRFICRMCD